MHVMLSLMYKVYEAEDMLMHRLITDGCALNRNHVSNTYMSNVSLYTSSDEPW